MSNTVNSKARTRILICRLSHIGDCILTLPLVKAIRQAKPDSWIAWAVEKPTTQLLDGHPDVDQLITIPKGWMKRPGTIWQVRRELRQWNFDVSIDPQSIAKSAMLARLSGAAKRIGFRGPHGRELSPWFNNQTVLPESSHLVDRTLELLPCLDIDVPERAVFDLPIREDAYDHAENFLNERGLKNDPVIICNPGASWPSKRWETERFGHVAKRLHEKTKLVTVVTWAGDSELEMAMSICRAAEGAAILAPRTDLQQLAAMLALGNLFVGCDTGPLHLAAAMGTPCVGLYGPTRPQDSGAYGTHHFAIQNKYHAGTSRERRNASNMAMATITVDQVVDSCCRALAANRLRDNRATRQPFSVPINIDARTRKAA